MQFNEKKFQDLANLPKAQTPFVSIYIPTNRTGQNQADRIRFKNALQEAVYELMEREDITKKEAEKYLRSGFDLLDEENFWMHLSDGLCVFIGQDVFEHFTLPITFDKKVFIGDHLYLSPTLPIVNNDVRYFILTLNQNGIRFFEAHRHSIYPVVISDLAPTNLEDALGKELTESQLRSHSGGNDAIYHGHGAGKDDKKQDLEAFFRRIDDGLMQMLHDENVPLILAGVDYLIPIYKSVSNYKNIVQPHISGNTESDDPVLLHEKSWTLMEPHYKKDVVNAKERFEEGLHNNSASFYFLGIIEAAVNGQVDTLFYDKNSSFYWGTFNEVSKTAILHKTRQKDSICLLELAVRKTLENGGTIYALEREQLPRVVSSLSAIFRYAITA